MIMPHPLVQQLRFARSELTRGLAGVTEEDARRRFLPMNCISWIVGHLAEQEQGNWLTRMQNQTPLPELFEHFANGRPATTPPLDEMWTAWHKVIDASDPYLNSLSTELLQQPMLFDGQPSEYWVGTVLQRQIYHYWYHLGECMAIRQMLGHTNLPEFVGDIHSHAPFQPFA
jgi:hypothetical protein